MRDRLEERLSQSREGGLLPPPKKAALFATHCQQLAALEETITREF